MRESKKKILKYVLHILGVAIILCYNNSKIFGQLDNSDWDKNNAACVPDALLYPGVGVATCGVVEAQAVNKRFTVAYIAMNAGPGTNRSEITNSDSTLHHSDWLVSSIGNVYGTAINQSTAEVFVTASSNYGSKIGLSALNSPSVLNYGSIASPANATEAAGRVYRIDPITGAVTVFATLPQQTTNIEHWDCERDNQDYDRSSTGVGLGNIAYDKVHNQFFVTNVEDGRIYRLSATGAILDSYDPGTLDNNGVGITDLEDIPYGLAIEPGSQRLFYGVVDEGSNANSNFANAGAPSIYSIDLNATGGWSSITTNNTSPTSYTWDNYVGSEQFHTSISTGGGNSYTRWTTYFISDLAFDPLGNLLVGVRVGCYGSWHSSYNHWGETNLVTLNTTTNRYNSSITEYNISVTGDAGNDDSYGGVAVYDKRNSDCDIWYLSSSADILVEKGPHGIAVWDSETTSNPVNPLGAFAYGVLPTGDPKGIGGDIELYNGCSATCDIAGPTAVCKGDQVTYSFTPLCPDSTIVWSVSGDAFIQGTNDQTSVSVLVGNTDFTVSLCVNAVESPCNLNVTLNEPILAALTNDTICLGSSFTPSKITTSVTNGISATYQWYNDNGTDNPTTTAIGGQTTATLTQLPTTVGAYQYKVIATSASGDACLDTQRVTLVINPLPTAIASSSSTVSICEGTSTNLSATGGGTYAWSPGTSLTASNISNPIATPPSTTTYTVTVTDANSCTDTDTVKVIVNTIPILSALSNDTICLEENFTTTNLTTNVTNAVPVTYQWYDNNGVDNPGTNTIVGQTTAVLTAFPTAVGIYSYQVVATSTDNTSCSTSQTVHLVINATPTVSIEDVLKCTKNSETISATATGGTAGYTYSWSDPSNSNPGNVSSFSTSIPGNYTVTISDVNGCTATATGELTLQPKSCLPVMYTLKRGPRE